MEVFRAIRPSHVGLLFVHMWIYCSTHRPPVTDDVSVMAVMYSALSVFLIALFLVVRRAARVGSLPALLSSRNVRAVDALSAVGMGLSGVLLALPLPVPGVLAAVVAAVAGGLGVGWVYLRWGEFYAKLDIHYATPLVFVTMALGSVGKTIVDFLPAGPAAFVLACLPFAAILCARRALATVLEACEPIRYYNDRTVGSLWRMALGIAVYSLTVGVIQSISLEPLPSPYYSSVLVHHGSEVLIAVAMVVWVAPFKRGISFSRTWRLVLMLVATALIFEPYLDPGLLSYLLSLVRTAQTFLIVFLLLALADIARHSSFHPFAVFSLGWVAYSLPFAAGKMVGDGLVALGPDATVIMSAIVWVLVMVTLFFLDEVSVGNHLVFTELNDGGGDDTPAKRIGAMQQALNEQEEGAGRPVDSLAARCGVLSDGYGLTPREREILELLARGRSKSYIADAFFISENTVRGHVKRLYAKLDVHSKQELLDKVEMVDLRSGA